MNVHVRHVAEVKFDIVEQLLVWYKVSQRSLPWRKPPSPGDYQRAYEVLVSESMLQQTRVDTVIKYYDRWMCRFPTLESVAQASQDDVLAQWAGLGYYSRATRLKEAAKYILAEQPTSISEWQNVPGCGMYTAGAVLSIAWGENVPCVDGNIERILTRICAIRGITARASTKQMIWQIASQIVEQVPGSKGGGFFNQALMDLGTAVCTPKSPKCNQCPLNHHCLAYVQAKNKKLSCNGCDVCAVADIEDSFCVESLPRKAPKKAARAETMAVLIYETDGKYLMRKNTEKKLLAGLYDFPSILLSEDDKELAHGLVASETRLVYKGTTLHLFSHIRRTSHVYVAAPAPSGSEHGQWLDEEDMKKLGISELARKNLAVLETAQQHRSSKKRSIRKDPAQPSVLNMWMPSKRVKPSA